MPLLESIFRKKFIIALINIDLDFSIPICYLYITNYTVSFNMFK